MDMQNLQVLIRKMVYPTVAVNSLAMYANRIFTSHGHEGLRELLAASCAMDAYKTVMMARRLTPACRNAAEGEIARMLAERCKSEDTFSHPELLAIAARKDAELLQAASAVLTKKTVFMAMRNADAAVACNLFRLSLGILPSEACAWVRDAFCSLLLSECNERMEQELPELMPCLLEHGVADVLSVLVKIAGAERICGFCGEELPEELDRLILSGMDSVGVWELFLHCFFRQEHSREELLDKGLWYVQLYANEQIYEQVCASFYLYVATRYGVEHPILAYMEDFSSPENDRLPIQRYKDTIRPLWEDPRALARFLEKTAPCNPFRKRRVQDKRYDLLQKAQDRTGYMRLQSLYEAGLPAGDILNIFFSTDLRERLPLEDVFYLAQRYEMLPGLLERLRGQPFIGVVTGQDSGRMFLAPYSYFPTVLHACPITYKVLEDLGQDDQLKGQELQYTITAFVSGYIQIEVCGADQLPEADEEDAHTWETAIEQLRQEKDLPRFSEDQLQQLAITEFTLDDVMEKSGLNLFTGLLMERPDCLEAFRKLLGLCKWNASFLKPEWPLPKTIFKMRYQYQQEAVELFRFLLESQEDMTPVLQLYFFSVYRAVLPLNLFLLFAPRERLLEQLPNYMIYCRLLGGGSELCRPLNINCAPVCIMEHTDGISHTDPFAAIITDIVVTGNVVSRILLQPYQMGTAGIEERGTLFGYLARNIHINQRRAQRLATLPSTVDCEKRELEFNMRCMEDAVLLRRANAAELKKLIRILGDANPFAFGVSHAAERVYQRKKKKRRVDVKDAAATMVLNARSIEDIRDFYLHTHIKFYIRLNRLAGLIRYRRADLEDQIPGMFDGVTFRAIADTEGNLWMPWISQNNLKVSEEYAGRVLSCQVRLEKEGAVSVAVTEAVQSEEFFEILKNCLRLGYQTDQNMDALVEQLLRAESAEEEQPEEKELSFRAYFSQTKNMLHSEPFSHEDFAEAIEKMIVSYEQPAEEMERAVVSLARKWLHLQPDREKIPPLLEKHCQCFVQRYQQRHLVANLVQVLYDYFGMEYAADFEMQLLGRKVVVQESDGTHREEQTFAQVCENLRWMLNGPACAPHMLLKRMGALIPTHFHEVSREEMETGIAELTALWMQFNPVDNLLLNEFLKMHRSFVEAYQTGSLGVIFIRQAYQYWQEDDADKLERGICKITYQNLKDHPELKQMLPPFEQRIARLQSWFQDPQRQNNDAGKRINRLLNYYNSCVPAEQMEQTVLELMGQLLPTRENHYQVVSSLHAHFEVCYGTSNIGKKLWQQTYERLAHDMAEGLRQSQPLTSQQIAKGIKRMIAAYHPYISEDEMRQAVLALVELWLLHAPSRVQLEYYLWGIRDCYQKYCQTDALDEVIQQLLAHDPGEADIRSSDEQPQTPHHQPQGTDTPDDTERI